MALPLALVTERWAASYFAIDQFTVMLTEAPWAEMFHWIILHVDIHQRSSMNVTPPPNPASTQFVRLIESLPSYPNSSPRSLPPRRSAPQAPPSGQSTQAREPPSPP